MTFHELNLLPEADLKAALFQCCGSVNWVNRMLPFFPVDDLVELLEDAEEQWYACSPADWREAFSHHPAIGNLEALTGKFAGTAGWAAAEQGAIQQASGETIAALAEANEAYEKKFGYIFIVCATGKSAGEMLEALQQRIDNRPEEEIEIAMDEQNNITLLRLQKLIT